MVVVRTGFGATSWSRSRFSNGSVSIFLDDARCGSSHEAIYQALLCQGPWSVKRELVRVAAPLGVALRVPRRKAPGKRKNFLNPGRS